MHIAGNLDNHAVLDVGARNLTQRVALEGALNQAAVDADDDK